MSPRSAPLPSWTQQVGSQTPTYAIAREVAALRERNEAASRRVNDVLTQRLTLEDKTRKAEARCAELQVGFLRKKNRGGMARA
jgi:hypothetical protein